MLPWIAGSRSLAQGDAWNRVSTHVPKGRGPFKSFHEAAVDALVNCAPYAARWKDWSAGGALTINEMYNGLAYFRKGIPSPYSWAATDQQVRGKYVADGVYDPNAWDTQLGCAAMLMRMGEIDPEAKLGSPGKKAETTSGVSTGAGVAVETARQTQEQGLTPTRALIVIGIAVVAAVAVYYIVRWVKRNKPKVGYDTNREASGEQSEERP